MDADPAQIDRLSVQKDVAIVDADLAEADLVGNGIVAEPGLDKESFGRDGDQRAGLAAMIAIPIPSLTGTSKAMQSSGIHTSATPPPCRTGRRRRAA